MELDEDTVERKHVMINGMWRVEVHVWAEIRPGMINGIKRTEEEPWKSTREGVAEGTHDRETRSIQRWSRFHASNGPKRAAERAMVGPYKEAGWIEVDVGLRGENEARKKTGPAMKEMKGGIIAANGFCTLNPNGDSGH
ncbi:hypothetical protein F0562_022342 [Nyssa sinensis]|uniref:Uncharacterized protein n=1 Tax=Nyssa sinensis TaxID=561372 RepID=A0A5J5BND9_9ASTE|nr:hypothetical protein F0562_022342 [Nyssa sinensis]